MPNPSGSSDGDDLRREQVEALKREAEEHDLLPETQLPAGDDQRPRFKLPTGNRELHRLAGEVGPIARATKRIFRRGSAAATVNAESKQFEIMVPDKFRTWISPYAAFFKEKFLPIKAPGGEIIRHQKLQQIFTMTVNVASGILSSDQFLEQLPIVERLIETRLPVFQRDGQINLLPAGIFEEQRIYTIDDGIVYDETMTKEEGCVILDDLYREFPFLNARSKSVQIAAALSMFCAPMLPRGARAPGFLYTANSPRAGKTLLAKCAIIPVAGSAAARALPRYEEARKVLDAIALESASYVLFDNIRGKIEGEEIESFITAPVHEARPLGKSTTQRVPNFAVVFLTGNQSQTSPDMAERCLWCELFVQEADSRDRKIKRVIDDAWLANITNRSRINSALWALVRSWDAAGRPPSPSSLAGFEEWSKLIPAIVLHAGYGDCLERPDIKGSETEAADMRTLVTALLPIVTDDAPAQSVEYQFDELIKSVQELGLFDDEQFKRRNADLFTSDGNITQAGRSRFGKLFSRYDRRLFLIDGRAYRFNVLGRGSTRRYQIEPL